MKPISVVALLTVAFLLYACGGRTTPSSSQTGQSSAGGTWQAVLSGGSGNAAGLDFITTFKVNSDNSLNVTGLEFLTAGACFTSGSTASGTLNASTNSSGQVTGMLSFTVQSGTPAGNTLTLSGTENGNRITGTWLLSGSSDCTDSPTGGLPFTMCQGTGTCTPAS